MKLSTILGLTLACGVGFGALPSAAQSPISDSFTVRNAAGAIVAQVIATEADEVRLGPGNVYIIPNAGFVDPSQFGNFTTLFETAGNPNVLSDIFGIAAGIPGCLDDAGFCLAFSSDVDGVPFPFGASTTRNFFEDGGVFDATLYLSAAMRANGFTATFISDPDTVPEPGSLALIGIAAVALALRRKSRA
jgi:hypothetical protein